MANCTIYTRAYSARSPRQLISGKRATGCLLTNTQLLAEFDKHRIQEQEQATALVSTSDRILDTISRALGLCHNGGVPPQDVWIVFIEVPNAENKHQKTPARTHRAIELAERCGLPDLAMYYHEIVFEWAIPEDWVIHQVSLQTLINRRDMSLMDDVLKPWAPSTQKLKDTLAEQLEPLDPWDIGANLAYCARTFGARAPTYWIAHQIFYDCVRLNVLCSSNQLVEVQFAEERLVIEDFAFFRALDDGIEEMLDSWLTGTEFVDDYKKFEDWRRRVEDDMSWDLVDFWAEWQNEEGEASYDEALDELSVKHEGIQEEIEEEAVRLGL